MLKTLLAATTALSLMSGIGFAETSYSSSTTETTGVPARSVDVTKSVRPTDHDGTMTEKSRTVERNADHDRTITERDKSVTKDTDVSGDGSVSRRTSETTTIR
jgi:hypothetical protein